jgi:hypothetical protein
VKAPALTEEEFQQQVVQAAHLLGWQHLHVRRTIGRGRKWTTSTNVKGWPDLFLWHPKRGFLALELKVRPNKATPEQVDVLTSLAAAGAAIAVVYPEHWSIVQDLLCGKTPGSGAEIVDRLALVEQRTGVQQ